MYVVCGRVAHEKLGFFGGFKKQFLEKSVKIRFSDKGSFIFKGQKL